MIGELQILSILRKHVPRKQWISSKDVYAIVESHGDLDEEDRKPRSAFSKVPQWKLVVRNVLLEWLKNGKIRSRAK